MAGERERIGVVEARQIVRANSGVADTLPLRDAANSGPRMNIALSEVGLRSPSDAIIANRNSKILGLLDILERRDPSFQISEVFGRLAARWTLATAAEEPNAFFDGSNIAVDLSNRKTSSMRKLPDGVDPTYNEEQDTIPVIFKEIFNPEEATGMDLSREWMEIVDEYVDDSSQENLAAIDKASESDQRIKKDLVIVGGGLLTSHAVSILSPYYNVTVITKDNRLVRNWRNRPIFINSSVENEFGANLPLLTGTTTPIVGQGQLQYIDPSILLGGDTLTVPCNDGTTREYVSGLELGKVAATNIVFGADDYILGQNVDFSRVTMNDDGSKRLTLIDDTTEEIRELDADTVLFLTGPGEEINKIKDEQSQTDYQEARQQVKSQIAKARETITANRVIISVLKSRSQQPGVSEEIARLEEQIKSIRITLPGILSLSIVEDLYDFWQHDQDKDSDAFPLRDVIKKGKRHAIAGGGDTAKTLTELLIGQGPKGAYPEEQDLTDTPTVVLYGLSNAAKNAVRRRYSGSLQANVTTAGIKAYRAYLHDGKKIGLAALRIQSGSEGYFNHIFVSTGIKRRNIEDELDRSGIDTRFVRDLDDLKVGLGNKDQGVYIGASATGLSKGDFPEQIQAIIDGLGIPENTISAWVNSLLLERMLWTIVAEKGPNVEKLKRLSKV